MTEQNQTTGPQQETYTDEDTARVRQSEAPVSSAGMPTEALPPAEQADQPDHPATPRDQRRRMLLALVLIVAGMLALAGSLLPSAGDMTAGMTLLTIGSVFLFFSFWRNIYGLLIPGSILAGLSVGVTFADLTNGASVLWGLAMGFMGILLVGRLWFNSRSDWPIYPAVSLFAVGVVVVVSSLPTLFAASFVWLPLLLIALGIFLGWRNRA